VRTLLVQDNTIIGYLYDYQNRKDDTRFDIWPNREFCPDHIKIAMKIDLTEDEVNEFIKIFQLQEM
jgi:hypothetical protein